MMTTTIIESITDRYPRTLYEWIKSDDKALLKAIADGQSVLEAAEDLRREHISVLRRLDHLCLLEFDCHSEEWVEVMGLGLAGVPLKVLIDWCTASVDRLPFEEIEGMAMGDLRVEFALARKHGIVVANSDAVGDLSWLATQASAVQAGYQVACERIEDAFDIVTPLTLKNQVLGIKIAIPARDWSSAPAAKPRARRYSKPPAGGAATYRRRTTAKSRGYGARATPRKAGTKKSNVFAR